MDQNTPASAPIQSQAAPAPVQSPTPAPISGEVHYAGFWIRFCAHVIDNIVVNLGGGIAALVIFFIIGLTGIFKGSPVTLQVSSTIFSFGVSWGYFIWMTHAKKATLGKMALGLVVQSEDGSNLTLGHIILRETIGKIVSSVLIFIGFIMAGFTAKKQALHDKMVHSVVVYTQPKKENTGWIIAVAIVFSILFVIAMVGIMSSIVLVSLNSARMKDQDAQIKTIISSTITGAIVSYDKQNTFKGTVSAYTSPECSGPLAINVSPDGKNIALFGKSCSMPHTYFCQSTDSMMSSYKQVTTIAADSIPSDKIDCK